MTKTATPEFLALIEEHIRNKDDEAILSLLQRKEIPNDNLSWVVFECVKNDLTKVMKGMRHVSPWNTNVAIVGDMIFRMSHLSTTEQAQAIVRVQSHRVVDVRHEAPFSLLLNWACQIPHTPTVIHLLSHPKFGNMSKTNFVRVLFVHLGPLIQKDPVGPKLWELARDGAGLPWLVQELTRREPSTHRSLLDTAFQWETVANKQLMIDSLTDEHALTPSMRAWESKRSLQASVSRGTTSSPKMM